MPRRAGAGWCVAWLAVAGVASCEPVTYTGIDYLALVAATGQEAAGGDRLHLANITGGGAAGQDEREDGH